MVRAQAHSLEAIFASFILVSGLVFAIQATAVTPLSASTSSQYIENQHQAAAEGVLAAAAETEATRIAVLNWDDSANKFYDAGENYYAERLPTNRFGGMLERTFKRRGIVANVYIDYEASNGQRRTRRMVYNGEPSDHAATATAMVTLSDDDVLYDGNEQPTGTTISGANFYAPDVSTSGIYNVLGVRVVVWRQ